MDKYNRKIIVDVNLLSSEIIIIIEGFSDNANAIKILENVIKKLKS